MASPVILVHGAFCGGWAFDAFKAVFEDAGYDCVAPDLPGHGPGEPVVGLSMNDFASAVVSRMQACDTPPILVGHSLGGLVCQMAAARQPVERLILLAPSAPWGVTASTMEEAAAAASLFSMGPYWTQAIEPDQDLAAAVSLDQLPPAKRRAALKRLVPESGRALYETFHWWLDPLMTTNVPFGRIKAPVLACAGGQDRIHPPASVRQTAERLGAEFKLYPQASHWLIDGPGAEMLAEDAIAWLNDPKAAAA